MLSAHALGGAAHAAHQELLIAALRRTFGEVEQAALAMLLPRVEWVELAGGEVLFHQGDADESLYFVVSGRLRAWVAEAGAVRTLGEISRGEPVGEMALFTGEARSASVSALRDTVLARVTGQAFREILLAHPQVAINVTRVVIERLKRAVSTPAPEPRPVTFGLAAISGGVDVAQFTRELSAQLARHGKLAVVTSETVNRWLGRSDAAQAGRDQPELSRQVALKLEEVEAENNFVLFIADPQPTAWTRRCLRHCDQILLVADADAPPALHPIESECLGEGSDAARSDRTLILLHPADRLTPRGTARWYDRRRLTGHLHLRRGMARDWARVGRVVSGNAIGLVLSGGGARGFAHLGIYRALEEAGLGCDIVAGTSIGAVMAAYIAMDLPAEQVIRLAGEAFKDNPTGDYNLLPLVSLIGGRKLRRVIDTAVVTARGEHIDIEDLWISYFCVSSNYSAASESVLARGPLAKSVRASVSIPGALPPVMIDGELHIDGGTFNNFPTDVMSRRGASRIIGVNLLRDRRVRFELEELPSPFALLRDKLRGKARKYRLPSLTSLLLNASMISSYAKQQEAQALTDLCFSPDVHRFGMLQWREYHRIVDAGYRHARELLASTPAEKLEALGLARAAVPARPQGGAAAALIEDPLTQAA
jgi:NTE family protein